MRASPLSPQRWCWLRHSPDRSRCASLHTHCHGLGLPGGSHAAPRRSLALHAPDPALAGERSRGHPCPSSSSVAQRRHETPRRDDRTKR